VRLPIAGGSHLNHRRGRVELECAPAYRVAWYVSGGPR
jgi:hypothetical protein